MRKWWRGKANNEVPLSIGGGIGQSRKVMLLLRKAHLGEVSVILAEETEGNLPEKEYPRAGVATSVLMTNSVASTLAAECSRFGGLGSL